MVLALAVILPMALEYVLPAIGESGLLAIRLGREATLIHVGTSAPRQAVAMVTILAVGLYVSSFSRGGLQGLLLALPLIGTAAAAGE